MTKCIRIDDSRSVIDDSSSVIDDPTSIIDDPGLGYNMFIVLASLVNITYDCQYVYSTGHQC